MKIKLSFLKKINKKDYIRIGLIVAIFIMAGLSFLWLRQYVVKLAQSGGITWFSHGPGMGGAATKVSVDPKNSNIVYVATDVAGVLKTTDAGAHWSPINNGLNNYNNGGVLIDKENSNLLYTMTDRGLYKSLNAGDSWTLKNSEIKTNKWRDYYGSGTLTLTQSQSDPNVLYAFSWEGDININPNTYRYFVYKSADRGETWTVKKGADEKIIQKNPDPKQGNPIKSIAIDPQDANIVYIGAEKGLYRTTDGGENWQRVTGLDSRIDQQLGYNESHQLDNTSVLQKMCETDTTANQIGDRIFSCNEGENQNECANRCVAAYNPPEDFFPTRNISKVAEIPGPKSIRSITINPYNKEQIFVLTVWGHIFRSENGGTSWDEIYHRDTPLASYGHYDPTKNFLWNDRDWYSFDTLPYPWSPRNWSFQTLKLDVNPDPANISQCRTDLSRCDYYIYANITGGESRKKTIWRINSSNIKLNGFIQESTPLTAGLQFVYGDREIWEPVLNSDSSGGNLTRNDWTFGKTWDGFAGLNMFDLDLKSAYPNRNLYAVGGWGAVKGIPSEKYKTVNTSQADNVTGYTYNLDWNWSWQGFENTVINDVLYDPLNPQYVYAALSDLGFIRSADGGKTFERSLTGIKISYPDWGTIGQDSFFGGHGYALAASVKDSLTTLYVSLGKWGYYGAELFKSVDNGASWSNASGARDTINSLPPLLPGGGGFKINNIDIAKNNPSKIFVASWQIMSSHEDCVKAFDNSKNNNESRNRYTEANLNNWQNLSCDSPANLAMWRVATQTEIDTGMADEDGRITKALNVFGPIYLTEDGSNTWQKVKTDGLPPSAWGVVQYNEATNTLYFGAFDYNCENIDRSQCSPRYGIYRLEMNNPDSLWQRLNTTVTDGGQSFDVAGRVLDLKINPHNSNDILAVAGGWDSGNIFNANLIRSLDGGITWSKIGYYPKTDIARINFDPYHSGKIALNFNNYNGGGDIGFVLSADNGQTWKQENTNIPSLITNSTAFHPIDLEKILLGLSGSGLAWSYDVFASPASSPSTSTATPTPKTTKKKTPTPGSTAAATPLSTAEPTSETTTIPPTEEPSPNLNTPQISRKVTPTPTTPAPTAMTSNEATPQTTPSSSTEISPSQSPKAEQLIEGSKQKRNIGIVLGIIAFMLLGFIFYKRFREDNR